MQIKDDLDADNKLVNTKIVDEVCAVNNGLLYFSCLENLTKTSTMNEVKKAQHHEVITAEAVSNLPITPDLDVVTINCSKFRDANCDTNGGLLNFSCSENFIKTPSVAINFKTQHCETQTDDVITSTPSKSKSIFSSLKFKLHKRSSSGGSLEDFSNGYDFIKIIPTKPSVYAEPQISTWINGKYLPISSIIICVAMFDKLDKCIVKEFLSIKGLKLRNFYMKSINAVTKVYKIEDMFVVVITNQAKTNCGDLIYALNTLTTCLKQRKDETFTITLDGNCSVNQLNMALDYITNCSGRNIKWILNIPFNMGPEYERFLSSRWITGDPSKFVKSSTMDELPGASPSYFKDLSAEYYYKNSVMEIMFYLKHSSNLIKSQLSEQYSKYLHLLPYAATSLRSVNIFIFDNHTKHYLVEPINKHQFGFDGDKLVKFCEDSNNFSTSHRYIFCSSGTEIMLDLLTYNHLNKIYKKENITPPNLTNVQGVPGCGKSSWIINNHKIGADLVLCATKEGLADLKLKVGSRCAKENIDFNKIKDNYKTIASYLINGYLKYETVFIDEYIMVHAGYIGLVVILSKCTNVFLLGDKNQIPYIDRLHHVNMQFSNANSFLTTVEPLNVTYRCPVDVTFALREFYPNISTKNSKEISVEFFMLPTSLSMLPLLDNTYYLTFTKADKKLVSQLTIPSTSKVLTIHEAQGLTSPNVICVRTNPTAHELFDSAPHAIVAISRHTRSFKYFSPVENDKLHSLVMKARSHTIVNAARLSSVTKPSGNPGGKPASKTLSGKCAIYYQNVNKMASKASSFYNFVSKSNYLIYVICETSFNPGICSTEFFGQHYVVYRCDRSLATSRKKSGGGVLIAVHSSLCSSPINFVPSVVEQVCAKIIINKRTLYIYSAYIPPQSGSDVFAKCSDAISEITNKTKSSDLILMLGDFNLPKVVWKFDQEVKCMVPFNITSEAEWILIDTMLGANLNQINNSPNERDHFLDLFFTNEVDLFKVIESPTPFVVNDIYHKSMEIIFDSVDLIPKKTGHNQQTTYNFNKADHMGLNQFLEAVKWDDILNSNDVNANVNQFYQILQRGFESHIPLSIRVISSHPPWFDDRLINLKNRKSKAYARMLKSRLESDKLIFTQYNDEFDVYFNLRYTSYLADVQEKIKTNPKQFWKYFRSKREIEGYPTNMSYNNTNSTNAKEIADMFASFFQSVYRPVDNNVSTVQTPNNNNNISIFPPTITDEIIMSALTGFGDGCGPDNIPSSLLKKHANVLVYPLRNLFNLSLVTGVFPDIWKISKITPIFKSGKREDIACYRGISTTSSIPKLFELVVCNTFKATLASHISVKQHGFIPGRSTSTNLVEFTSRTIKEIEKHYQMDVVYTDFSKAFDSICHCKALDSLQAFGFTFKFVKWFSSYLSNRTQYVLIGNKKSKAIKVTSGVPQGSHIGPWIFLVFIDQVTEVIRNSNVLIFADDIKIFHTIKERCDTDRLQEDINGLSEWCDRNSLHLNIKKCKVMSFHRKKNPIITTYNINGNEIQRVYEITDLGVTFVENVSFNRHIDNCIAKSNSMFGFVKRWTGEFMDIQTLCTLYFAYVRSQVEYAVIVWNPYYDVHIKRIESIQKKFLIFLLKKTGWDYDQNIPFYQNVARLPSYSTRCKEYNVCSLENRRVLLDAAFIGNVLLGHIDSAYVLENISINVPCRTLRNHRFLALEHHSTNYGENNPINRLAKSFNTAEDQFDFNLSKNDFKKKLKTYFLNL